MLASIVGSPVSPENPASPESPAEVYPDLLLEDFDTLRLGTTNQDLWNVYLTEDPDQTGGYDAVNKWFSVDVPVDNGLYVDFRPHNYNTDAGHARYYIKNGGVWNNAYNRITFWMRSDTTSNQRSQGNSGLLHFGTYTRENGTVPTNQGAHFYHYFNPKMTANRWHKFIVTKMPQHQVGQSGAINWGLNYTLTNWGFDYFYGLTRFYVDNKDPSVMLPGNYILDDFYFSYNNDNLDDLIASVSMCHNGTGYNIAWSSLKGESIDFTVYVSDQSMKANGLGVGTSIGTNSTPDTAYADCLVNSGPIAEYAGGTYVAIVPSGDIGFSEFFLENRHN